MAYNKTKFLKDITLSTSSYTRSTYIKNKEQYTNKKYNKLYLKDIVADYEGHVWGVCDCECGNNDVVTNIGKLVRLQTISCGCSKLPGNIHNTKYEDKAYIGKKFGHLEVIDIYRGTIGNRKGVIWKTRCTLCGTIKDFCAALLLHGTTISCGCLLNDRNNKYSETALEGTYVNDTLIVKVLSKEESGDSGQKWICKCRYCGKLFTVLARKLNSKHTNSCGCLSKSIGEHEIEKWLSKHKVKFVSQWKSEDLLSKYGYMLRYDFAILDDNNSVIALIEYDGEQHYDILKCFSPDLDTKFDQFDDIRDSDNRKNEYASNIGVPLLRIRYNRDVNMVVEELQSFLYNNNIIE